MAIPAPRVWVDGEEAANLPTADDLNLDWRDSFDFLLGYSRPFIYLESNVSQTGITAGTLTDQNWQVENVKRGGMTHAANASTITVPYTGQYDGFAVQSYISLSAPSTTALTAFIIQNGSTGIARWDMVSTSASDMQNHGSFTANLTAGDTLLMRTRHSSGTAATATDPLNRPRIAIWYAGDF
jgi:hypothetical protein